MAFERLPADQLPVEHVADLVQELLLRLLVVLLRLPDGLPLRLLVLLQRDLAAGEFAVDSRLIIFLFNNLILDVLVSLVIFQASIFFVDALQGKTFSTLRFHTHNDLRSQFYPRLKDSDNLQRVARASFQHRRLPRQFRLIAIIPDRLLCTIIE